MAFAAGKALVLGAAVTIGMLGALYFLKPGIDSLGLVLQSVITGLLSGAAFGWLMRSITVELPGQSVEQIESALDGSLSLRGLKRIDGPGGEVRFERGKGPFGDCIIVRPTATGVMIEGPANLIRISRKRAAV